MNVLIVLKDMGSWMGCGRVTIFVKLYVGVFGGTVCG